MRSFGKDSLPAFLCASVSPWLIALSLVAAAQAQTVTFRDITAMAQQLFGGIGFTLDFDIQLYFRRAKQQQLMWANDRVLEHAVAASLLD